MLWLLENSFLAHLRWNNIKWFGRNSPHQLPGYLISRTFLLNEISLPSFERLENWQWPAVDAYLLFQFYNLYSTLTSPLLKNYTISAKVERGGEVTPGKRDCTAAPW
jgi:hypothetical protein